MVIINKTWYKSKGFMSGLLISLGTLVVGAGQFLNGDIEPTALLQLFVSFLTGTGIIGIRDAMK